MALGARSRSLPPVALHWPAQTGRFNSSRGRRAFGAHRYASSFSCVASALRAGVTSIGARAFLADVSQRLGLGQECAHTGGYRSHSSSGASGLRLPTWALRGRADHRRGMKQG